MRRGLQEEPAWALCASTGCRLMGNGMASWRSSSWLVFFHGQIASVRLVDNEI
jgi:hypothetical protein